MYEIENDIITKVIAIGEMQSLVKISVIDNQQMVVQFLNGSRPIEKRAREKLQHIYLNGLILITI